MTNDLLMLFLIHFLADFRFQSREMGKKKSEEFKWLAKHFIILLGWFTAGIFLLLDFNGIAPSPSTTITVLGIGIGIPLIHCIQDWYMWRLYKWKVKRQIARENFDGDMNNTWMDEEIKIFKYWEDPKFYDTIGLDQTLHFITIILVYNWVM